MERWEGTIEYTFMAPISRFTHMVGSCLYAVAHGLLFTFIQLLVVGAFFHLDLSHANYLTVVFMFWWAASRSSALASPPPYYHCSTPKKVCRCRLSYVRSSCLYRVSTTPYRYCRSGCSQLLVFPLQPMSWKAYVPVSCKTRSIWSPEIWSDTWPLIITGIVSIPVGIYIFGIAERYAKRTGKLKRNG